MMGNDDLVFYFDLMILVVIDFLQHDDSSSPSSSHSFTHSHVCNCNCKPEHNYAYDPKHSIHTHTHTHTTQSSMLLAETTGPHFIVLESKLNIIDLNMQTNGGQSLGSLLLQRENMSLNKSITTVNEMR